MVTFSFTFRKLTSKRKNYFEVDISDKMEY